MALSRAVSEILNVEKCRDLEIGVRGHSRSLKVVPFDRACMVSIRYIVYAFLLVFCSNFFSEMHRFEIFDLQVSRDLETCVWVTQGHWKCRHVIEHI